MNISVSALLLGCAILVVLLVNHDIAVAIAHVHERPLGVLQHRDRQRKK